MEQCLLSLVLWKQCKLVREQGWRVFIGNFCDDQALTPEMLITYAVYVFLISLIKESKVQRQPCSGY